jgi:Domain of unknown function (DUF4272)
MSEDSIRRRGRSRALLEREGVPCRDGLPLLPGEDEAVFPTAEAVALRALALLLIAGEATGMRPDLVDRLIDLYFPTFSPAEWHFFESPERDPAETLELGWRFEAALPLLWAAGLAPDLPRPEAQAEPFDLLKLVAPFPRDELLARASLRDPAELLDSADLHLCWDDCWHVARFEQRPTPARLDGAVVTERRRAFAWLLQGGGEWDSVVGLGVSRGE